MGGRLAYFQSLQLLMSRFCTFLSIPLFPFLPRSRIRPSDGYFAVHLRLSRQAYLTDEIPRLGVQGAVARRRFGLLALALALRSSLATAGCREAESGGGGGRGHNQCQSSAVTRLRGRARARLMLTELTLSLDASTRY